MFSTINLFAGITEGKFQISVDTPSRYGTFTYELNDVKGMVDLIKPFTKDGWKLQLMTSSSIDFPEEEGAPEDFNARKVIDEVFSIAMDNNVCSVLQDVLISFSWIFIRVCI